MIHVRPIQADELSSFVAVATDAEHVPSIRAYVDGLIARGVVRLDGCHCVERDGQPVGRVAFWALPRHSHPTHLVLLDLPWEEAGALEAGDALLDAVLRDARALGASSLGHVIDAPPQWPQWQSHPEARAALLARHGFTLARETLRFELDAGEASPSPAPGPALVFRSFAEVGEEAFRRAILRVSSGSLDRHTQAEQQRVGPDADAAGMLAILQSMDHEDSWWELAFTPGGALVGLVVPAVAPSAATIGYVGVVPEMRGKRMIDPLLARGTATLLGSGARCIRADTDTLNAPMASAFRRAGYRDLGTRREYSAPLAG